MEIKKLKNKVFWTIFGILTGALLISTISYNVHCYINTQSILRSIINAQINPISNSSKFQQNAYFESLINNFLSNLFGSILIFIIFTILFFIITRFLTNWIVVPVEKNYKKQKDFIADASHELKTPLSVIVASSDALSENPKETKWIKNIQDESIRMNTLISKLLDLASLEKSNSSSFKENNLSKLVELSALTFEGRAIEKNLTIQLNIQPNITFKFNEDDIKQLVEILLDNAIKHSYKDNVVELNLYVNNKSIILSAINFGDNISSDDIDKIFDRFYKVDKSRSQKDNSYGLGLSIAKNIVENHGGSIHAESKNNKNKFIVLF